MGRITEQKQEILGAFKEGYAPTAEELLTKLRKKNQSFSRATLYRNLSSFCEDGTLTKISAPGMTDRYELDTGCCYHVVCEICGKVDDLPLGDVIPDPEYIYDYAITHHELMFYGICEKCQKDLDM